MLGCWLCFVCLCVCGVPSVGGTFRCKVIKPPPPQKKQDKNGATPLDLAVKKSQCRVAAFLRAQALEARFAWRQLLSVQHWRAWLQGGGNAEVI